MGQIYSTESPKVTTSNIDATKSDIEPPIANRWSTARSIHQQQPDDDTRDQRLVKYYDKDGNVLEYRSSILATNTRVKLLSLRPIQESHEGPETGGRAEQNRRSSFKNLILGDAIGPRFSQDLCSLSSAMSDYSFGIEFPRGFNDTIIGGDDATSSTRDTQKKKDVILKLPEYNPSGDKLPKSIKSKTANTLKSQRRQQQVRPLASYPIKPMASRRLSNALTLASIDLGSFDADLLQVNGSNSILATSSDTSLSSMSADRDLGHRFPIMAKVGQFGARLNDRGGRHDSRLNHHHQFTPNLMKSKNNLATEASSLPSAIDGSQSKKSLSSVNPLNETKSIILMQVCLPFILAGFGNLSAGLLVNKIIAWEVFRRVPAFIIMLTAFVGFKGNIEMTMASRLSTLANLGLLNDGWHIRRAYVSNLFLVYSQAISLSLFASILALAIDFLVVLQWRTEYALIVLASSQLTAIILVSVSSVAMILSVMSAKCMSVNPDNFSTLVSALYGDVSAVFVYATVAQFIFTIDHTFWPMIIVCASITIWPVVTLCAYRSEETHSIALSSNIPIMIGIMVSLVSGFIFSKVYHTYARIALFHPVVNGFGANVIAVQASRVSTWLWCSALDKVHLGMGLPNSLTTRKLSSLDARRLHSTGSIRVKYLGRTNPNMHQETSSQQSDEDGNDYGLDLKKDGHHTMPAIFYGSSSSSGGGSNTVATKAGVSATDASSSSSINGSQRELVDDNNNNECACSSTVIKHCWSWLRNLGKAFAHLTVKIYKALFWSYLGPSPNAKAAKMLLVMLMVAQTIYFFVIWLAMPNSKESITLTFSFYATYIVVCLVQVALLLMICEPLMTLLMSRNLDPDTYGITLLMATADLLGTICLASGFYFLAKVIGDVNAS